MAANPQTAVAVIEEPDSETVPAETYPWDRVEPFVPTPSVSLIIVPATTVAAFDRQSKSSATWRIVGLEIGGVALHTGLQGGDAEIIEVIDRLIEPLQELRQAALRRLAEAVAS